MRLKDLLESKDYIRNDGSLYFTESDLFDGKFPPGLPNTVSKIKFAENGNRKLKLKSLEGCPQIVTGAFTLYNNWCKSLVGGPTEVGGDFTFMNGKITSLDGAPQIVGGEVRILDNPIITMEGIGKRFLKSIGEKLIYPSTIKSNMLGICLIDKLTSISIYIYVSNENCEKFKVIESIINPNLKSKENDLLDAKEQLMANGLKEYAKL